MSKAVSGMMSPDDNESERDILLSCRGLWFRYDRDLPDVIRGLDLSLKRGEFYCLLGGNGSGKSTLLSILCRINKPYRGKISLGGRKLESYSDRELYREFLGVLPQDPRALFAGKTVIDELYEMTGGRSERKNADYHIAMDKSEAVEGIAHLTHLERYLDRHPYDLSGGEQQRLALAKILLLRPKLILMDEPTKGMDGCFKQEFAEMISRLRDQGVTIFMISHDIEFAAMYADRCGLLFDGKISSSGTSHEFFAGNSFYTTAANRMARDFFPEAVTCKDVVECLKKVNTVKIS